MLIGEVITMSKKHEINKMIIDEIDDSNADPTIKELVKDILYYEIGNIGEKNFSNEYERMIVGSLHRKQIKK